MSNNLDNTETCIVCGRPFIDPTHKRPYCGKCGKKKSDKLIKDWNELSEEEQNKLLGI